jgi:hypothetical protein
MKASTRYLPSRITSPISSSASCVMHSLTNKGSSRGALELHRYSFWTYPTLQALSGQESVDSYLPTRVRQAASSQLQLLEEHHVCNVMLNLDSPDSVYLGMADRA